MPEFIMMPALSPTMTQGFLVKWHKSPGDVISPGDLLMDVETDKAVMEVESTQSGILDVHISVVPGRAIEVGKTVAVLRSAKESPGCGQEHISWWHIAPEAAIQPSVGKEAEKNITSSEQKNAPVAFGGPVQAKMAGAMERSVKDGGGKSENEGGLKTQTWQEGFSLSPQQLAQQQEMFLRDLAAKDYPEGIASPVARAWAKDWAVPLSYVTGTGPGGRITLEDVGRTALAANILVERALSEQNQNYGSEKRDARTCTGSESIETERQKNPSPASEGKSPAADPLAHTLRHIWGDTLSGSGWGPSPASEGFAYSPISAMRHTIARRLSASKQSIPHFYLTIECNVGALLRLRESLNTPYKRFSVNDLMIKACALSLAAHPKMRTLWEPRDGDTVQHPEGNLITYEEVDLAVAVSLDNGLITPIIPSAQKKTLTEIASTMQDLVQRGRKGALKPQEYTGGIFTLSNLGMMNISHFQPIINPPQSGILAISAPSKKVIWGDNGPEPAHIMALSLAADHRVVDGQEGAKFLNTLRIFVENPYLLLQ